jgi:hypothetical protein
MMMEWKGAWSKDVDYTTGAVVTQGGGTYVALNNIAKNGTAPPSDAWGVLAAPAPPSINWTGVWDPRKQYQINDAVSYDVPSPDDVAPQTEEAASTINSYIAVRVPPVGNKPTDTSFWQAMSSNKEIQQGNAFIAMCISAGGAAASAIAASITALVAWTNLKAQAAKAGLDAGLALTEAATSLAKSSQADIKAGEAKIKAGEALLEAEKALVKVGQAIGKANDALTKADGAVKGAQKAQETANKSMEYTQLVDNAMNDNEYRSII